MTTPNLFTSIAPTQSYTAVNGGMDGADQTEGQALYQQASQSHQPDVLVKRQFEQRNQNQKSKLANEFVASAGREGVSQLAATPDGQHALAVVYDHAGSDSRGLMRQVHEEHGSTAVDYTDGKQTSESSGSMDGLGLIQNVRNYGGSVATASTVSSATPVQTGGDGDGTTMLEGNSNSESSGLTQTAPDQGVSYPDKQVGVPRIQMNGIYAPRQESIPGWGTPRDLYDVTIGLTPIGGAGTGISDAYQDYENGTFSAGSVGNVLSELLPGPNLLKMAPNTDVANKADLLRQGKDVHVKDIKEAREIQHSMPEMRPGPGNAMPGLRDRRNTYRGDLINTKDPTSPKIHDRGKHANQPHFNIDIRDKNNVRQKPAIFIDD